MKTLSILVIALSLYAQPLRAEEHAESSSDTTHAVKQYMDCSTKAQLGDVLAPNHLYHLEIQDESGEKSCSWVWMTETGEMERVRDGSYALGSHLGKEPSDGVFFFAGGINQDWIPFECNCVPQENRRLLTITEGGTNRGINISSPKAPGFHPVSTSAER